ncbi:irregular chiasm C-roughest protein-like isoform X2 [Gigantopelta aegis]|uniref:irregular chiasm C-roughest protein-like isoform X2 n=1 Tax=Gigantopelta aegis TaxID=1735272 RepID=UPI001B88AC3B|nr:irregular chiasm C-roughest protein-like isoform X2 [Gigantopelta aegis]
MIIMDHFTWDYQDLSRLWRFCLLVTLLCSEVLSQQRFLVEPQDTSAIEGSTTVLYCKVASRIGPLQWTRDSFALGMERNLPGFDRYSMIGSEWEAGAETIGEFNLQIRNVQLEDDAIYDCQMGAVEGVPGMRSRKAKLMVLIPPDEPVIEGQPIISVILGRPTNITCRANNSRPGADITWHISNRRLTDRIYSRSVPQSVGKLVDSVGILTINATKSDSGKQLECRAQNEALNEPRTVTATINVQYPPEIQMSINVSDIREFSFVQFSCHGLANPAFIRWRWFRNDIQMAGETRNRLTIRAITREWHEDKIACEGFNAVGKTRKQFTLNVEFGPRFTKPVEHQAVDVGQTAVLRCEAEGNPPPHIIWTKKGSHHIQGSSPELKIMKVQEGSFGIYVCTANVMGFNEISREVYLLENGKPKIMSDAKQYASRGEKAKLECSAVSVPKPFEIRWSKAGIAIDYPSSGKFSKHEESLPYGQKSILQILDTGGEDFGDYNCTVKNIYGEDMAVISLIEKVVPPLPYIIGGAVGGVAVLFIIILACVLYHRYKNAESGSVLGSYTDTDSSSDKKREKSDSPSTLMDQWRQDYNKDFYRYSADYDEVNLGFPKEGKANNNAYGVIEPYPLEVGYRDDGSVFAGEYQHRTDEVGSIERFEPTYNGQYPLTSFKTGEYSDSMSRLPPPDFSSKLATNV